ncbi:MAG: PhoH family protein, partial [Actinomycetes bacterium]
MLTAEQQAVVRLLATRDRVLVSGYAGTGKTFMAINRAVTMWDAKTKAGLRPRIGIVCFNVALAQHIRQEMLPPDTGIEVFHFHQLCDDAGREAGMEPVLRKDEAYLSRGCVERLEESFLSGRLRPFDALIIDEAQDLEPAWIVAMDECLLVERGSIAIFYDPLQELYERGDVLRQRFGAPYPVTMNCRNSVAICDLVQRTLPAELAELRVPAAAMPGAAPRIQRYVDDQEQRHQLARIVEFLIGEHGLRPRQIVLLAPFQKAKTCLANETKLC